MQVIMTQCVLLFSNCLSPPLISAMFRHKYLQQRSRKLRTHETKLGTILKVQIYLLPMLQIMVSHWLLINVKGLEWRNLNIHLLKCHCLVQLSKQKFIPLYNCFLLSHILFKQKQILENFSCLNIIISISHEFCTNHVPLFLLWTHSLLNLVFPHFQFYTTLSFVAYQ